MLMSMPAGAIADMYDRRIVTLLSLGMLTYRRDGADDACTAWLDYAESSLIGFLFRGGLRDGPDGAPAWQASISEQVPTAAVPAAVTLNGISYNIARSIGPSIGGCR